MPRSRSPRGKAGWSEWISRKIVSFGRHPRERPKGLNVDAAGNMYLDQLMDVWGSSEGLAELNVLAAIQEHMFHEDGQLRFSIDEATSGRMKIRVFPKRGRQDHWNRGVGGGGNPKAPRPQYGKGKEAPAKGPSRSKKSELKKAVPKAVPELKKGLSTAEKLDMPLDEISTDIGKGKEKSANRRMAKPSSSDGGKANGKGRRIFCGSFGDRAKTVCKKERECSSSPQRHRNRDISRSSSPGDGDNGLASAASSVSKGVKKEAPPPPPGAGWTKYTDDGIKWWYYEGDIGKWWCTDDDREAIAQLSDEEDD